MAMATAWDLRMRAIRMVALTNVLLVAVATLPAGAIPPLPVPPMGYSTWQWFPGDHWGTKQGQYDAVNETVCREQVDAMVAKGLVAQGYTVFVVDEPCFAGRDNATGALVPNSTTWPNGFSAFAKYLNARGMELGIYTDAGEYTCQGCPASAGHEAQDMETFMSWGASYVKVDRCFGVDNNNMRENLPETFAKYRVAANAVSPPRRIQISAILAATDNCWEWCNGTCDHCRTTGDITNSFSAMQGHVDSQESIPFIEDFAGVGYFNDLDMLIVGNMSGKFYGGPGLNLNETKAHLALWSILKSPMLLSCDVRSLTDVQLDLLTNPDMLAMFNDPLALQAKRIQTTTGNPAPSRLSFGPCPPATKAPLGRQTWKMQAGELVSLPSARAVTLSSCGSRVLTCGNGTKSSGDPIACLNTSCANARTWTMKAGAAPSLITNSYNNECLEGMLGPQDSFLQTSPCDATNVKQQWTYHTDQTLRAFGQCLAVEALPSAQPVTVDIFAVSLSNGDKAVVLFNTQPSPVEASLDFTQLGWTAETSVVVRDIWGKHTFAPMKGQFQPTVDAHGVVFARLTPQK